VRGPVLALGVPRVGPRGIREESRDISTLKYYVKGGVILLYKLIIIIE
jgi:hypothetical protein